MRSSAAPELTVVPPAPVPSGPLAVSAEDIPSFSIPKLIVVAPVYVFAPETVKVPAPFFVIPLVPEPGDIIPLMVKSTAVVPSSATVKVLVAPFRETKHEIVAPTVPVVASVTVTFPPSVKVPVPVIDASEVLPQ